MAEKHFRHRTEWIIVRLLYGLFELLGRERASSFGAWIARTVGPRLSVHGLAKRNMKRALPELDDKAIDRNLMQMWDNLGRNVAEIPFLKDILADPDAIEVVGGEYLDARADSGEAAFFATAHYGPWETVGMVGKYSGVKTVGIYRAANNPLVDAFFQDKRLSEFYEFAPKGPEGARSILSLVKEKGNIILLNDQKMNTGISVPFFGREAMTAPAIAEIALKKNVPIYPTRTERIGKDHFRLVIYPPLDITPSGDRTADVYRILKAINEYYEDWIRERPDHWFWVHNRWIE